MTTQIAWLLSQKHSRYTQIRTEPSLTLSQLPLCFRSLFCCYRPFGEFTRNSEHVYITQVLPAILRKVYNMLQHTLERDMSAWVIYNQMARWHTLHLISFSVQWVYCLVTKFKRTLVRWRVHWKNTRTFYTRSLRGHRLNKEDTKTTSRENE